MRACPVCATAVPPGNAFCGACGARLPASESTATEDALIGQVIDGRFRVIRLLGSGGMGAVYLAEHVGIGKRVAVKVVRADLRGNPDLVRRFRREAMTVSKLTDLHTITVFDFGIWKGLIYLVMEYLRGMDLADVLGKDRRLPVDRALRIAHQICSSLAEAHSLGVVHRDLKPENIFVSQTTSGDELIKVLDFGLAKLLGPVDGPDGHFQTADGTLMGTPYYMAPEIIRGESVDGRADIYALGTMLFRMLVGRYAFTGARPLDVLDAHLKAPIPVFSSVAPEAAVPAAVEALVRKMMARDPKDRFADAMSVDAAIRQTLPDAAPTQPPPAIEAEAPAPKSAPTQAFAETLVSDPDGVFALGPLPAWDSVPLADRWEPPTRDEFVAYERRLRWSARVRSLMVAMLLVTAGGFAWVAWNRGDGPLTQEVEPNDEPRIATRLALGGQIVGYLGARTDPKRSDRDVYVVRLRESESKIEASVTGVPSMDLVLEVFDGEGNLLGRENTAGVGEGETLTRRFEATPIYVVVREVWVQGERPSENSTDAYTLKIRSLTP